MKKKWTGIFLIILTVTAFTGCEYRKDMTAEEMESDKKSILMEEYDTPKKGTEVKSSADVEATAEEQYIDMTGFVEDEYICVGNAAEYKIMDLKSDEEINTRLTVNSAKVYDSKDEMPEYFSNSTQSLSYFEATITDENGEMIDGEVETVYVLVNVTIRNMSSKESEFSVASYYVCSLYEDMSGQVYGFSTTRRNKLSLELDYDLETKKIGKSFYFFDMKAGEEVTTNLCFMIPKQELESELYLCNGYYMGSRTDKQKGKEIEYDAPATEKRYIKLEVEK